MTNAPSTSPSADDRSAEVLLITSRRLADDDHGGGVRTARIAEALAGRYRVTVAEPGQEDRSDAVDPARRRIPLAPGALDLRLAGSRASTEGASLWRGIEAAVPAMNATGAPVVYWADAILASAGIGRILPDAVHVVEFANVESRRYLAMTLDGSVKRRAFALWESAKAVHWQRAVARRAGAVVTLAPSDARAIRTRRPKLLVLNGVQPPSSPPIRSTGATVLAVGSWWYGPNRHGMRRFLRRDWPRIRAATPEARLLIVGRGGEGLGATDQSGVEVRGFVDDLDALYAAAAVVLAPARSGGGSQLKLVGALARERIVVGPPFLAREQGPAVPLGAFRPTEDMGRTIVHLLASPRDRHAVEDRIAASVDRRTWQHAAEPLFRFLDEALRVRAQGARPATQPPE